MVLLAEEKFEDLVEAAFKRLVTSSHKEELKLEPHILLLIHLLSKYLHTESTTCQGSATNGMMSPQNSYVETLTSMCTIWRWANKKVTKIKKVIMGSQVHP